MNNTSNTSNTSHNPDSMKFALLRNGRMIASFQTSQITINQVTELLAMGYAIQDWSSYQAERTTHPSIQGIPFMAKHQALAPIHS